MEEIKDRYKNVFDAYLRLQAETWELVLRNVSMQRRLSEAYDLLKETPETSAAEVYSKLKDKFEGIYGDLFAMSFRPFRVLVQPYSEFLKVHSEAFTPEFWFERYMDLFRMWGETQSSFLKGIANVYQSSLRESQAENSEGDVAAQMREPGPVNLLREIVDEESKAYLEMMSKYLEYFGQTQFLMPKTFVVYLRNGISSYAKMYGLWRRYESMLHDGWEKSLEKFADAMAKAGKPPGEIKYEEFYGTFVETFSNEYDELLKSKEFVEAQNDVISTLADIFYNFEKVMEAQLDMFPILPFAPRSEIDTIEKRLYSYSRVVTELEKDTRRLKDRLKITPTSEELNKLEERMMGEELAELKRRVDGVEKEIKRLGRKAGKEGLEI